MVCDENVSGSSTETKSETKEKIINQETIAAIATAAGRGSVGIVRVSGQKARDIALDMVGFLPKPRMATFTRFKDQSEVVLDEGLVIFFPAPHSYTGEDVLEFQGHGGPVVLDQLLQQVLSLGARLARPGEFTERAYLNKKLSLTQAEAVIDLINATSEQAARSAVQTLQGVFSERVHTLLRELTELRMWIEAALDFPEEEIDFLSDGRITARLRHTLSCVSQLLSCSQQGALLREGLSVVLIGRPNAGKSSLLNALSGRDVAIVTPIPGTTRDVLRESIHLDGVPLHVLDTAGLHQATDIVEQEGIRRAREAITRADMVLGVMDMTTDDEADFVTLLQQELGEGALQKPLILIKNKADLVAATISCFTADLPNKTVECGDLSSQAPQDDRFGSAPQAQEVYPTVTISTKTGAGLDTLKALILKQVGFQQTNQGVFMARRRHLEALQETETALQRGVHGLVSTGSGELLAEELRLAQRSLSEITGEFTSDDLLGKIFSEFCIGK